MRLMVLAFCCVMLLTSAGGLYANKTQDFLRKNHHSWLPYCLPYEGSMEQVKKVCELGMDTVGIVFAGPYNGGNIEFGKLDEALKIIGDHGQKMVLFLTPRFSQSDNVIDRMSNGEVIVSLFDRSPNYSIMDVFDPAQRAKYNDYVARCAKRYGSDRRVAAFVTGWGYQGENGFFTGDWVSHPEQGGTLAAGYSEYAMKEFNKWRAKLKLPAVTQLPLPSSVRQSDDYILFMQFRSDFVRNVFQREHIAAAKSNTKLPVGNYAYISAYPENYARNWTDTPNADFYRSAGSCATFDMTRTLMDSGIGWEDSVVHDGRWDFTAACMERDEARQIAKGAVFHAMTVQVYDTEPQWEKGVFPKIVEFLKTQQIYKSIRPVKSSIALFQPTWGVAAIRSRNSTQIFGPDGGFTWYISKMMGLAESFGLPYKLVTESELMDPVALKSYKRIIVPMWETIPRIVGQDRYKELSADKRVVGVPLKDGPLTRTEFRAILTKAGIKPQLEFDSDRVMAGRTANLVYNWDAAPIEVQIPGKADKIMLKSHEWKVLEHD